jgi:uncharacterized Zn finger protein
MARESYFGDWAPYVPVAQRRLQAERKAAALKKKGQICKPVAIEGRTIARSVWGKAWCDNLEAYSDYANRLPRGRTYVRNGSVIDLRIDAGKIKALVSGSEVYRVEIDVHPLEAALWKAIVEESTGKVDSLIELLQGRLSKAVMEVVTRRGTGLFPLPRQLGFRCSCPDAASMCKHVAATLYGVGARLDAEPELLFRLRHVEPNDLIRQIGDLAAPALPTAAQGQLERADLSALFGIDLDDAPAGTAATPPRPVVVPDMPAAQSPPSDSSPTGRRPGKKPKAAIPVILAPSSTPAVPKAAKAAVAEKKRAKTVTAGELIARGIPRHMIQAWLGSGVLLATAQRGEYRTTQQTEAKIKDYAILIEQKITRRTCANCLRLR